ncbi:TRAP transporter, 4TM/12TM fusion protein [Alkaliphilus metalliredigens QYMF]|uniref:TRAP transporter, 4TM/12TM fusion protein n=1 Tax=Alkaliphilus metalliredigens (strain QYMF) TaxID=293826 RepID=A6TKZ9_ALKMQ|nr:TRAP transporter permease [Alkaliphilus metalliredigens]ABR46867.1 TRAP transporter, 4TM/12TM fusion protein [Alkaliphilus metalliredigens QYMF]
MLNEEKQEEITGKAKEILEKNEDVYKVRVYLGSFSKVVTIIAVFWSLFQLYATGFGVFDAIRLRAWHIIFLFTMAFLLYPTYSKEKKVRSVPPIWDIVCIALSIGSFGYLLLNYQNIVLRGGYLLPMDYIIASVAILLVFEVSRRVVKNLAVLAAIFFLYNFLGQYIPGAFGHGGFSWRRVVQHMFWGSQGILGVGVGVSTTFIFVFILFGVFLKYSGFSEFINDLALSVAGGTAGGPAKVAVLASALMGMINGSALANVATTGVITIPLMKKNGYKADFAGAVEAVASTGGQFAPPIMGAVGFVMAEYLGVPYVTIMFAAAIPAFLYYLSLILAVHFEAKKQGLRGISKENLPKAMEVIKQRGHLCLPLITLIIILFLGYTALYAAIFAMFSTIVASWLKKETRMYPRTILQALDEGARSVVGVGVACVIIGIVVGTVSLTGLGLTFGYEVTQFVGEGQLLLGGILIMLISIVLGMGVPGIAAYVIVAAVAAPVLIRAGAIPIAAHMFVLMYASLSNITPPVAMSSYVAAGISGADENKTSYIAMKLGLTGFIIPFFFITNPILLLQDASIGPAVMATLSATVGIIALTSVLQRWLITKNNLLQQAILLITAYLTIQPSVYYDLVGLGFFITILVWQTLINKKEASASVEEQIPQ